jgi:glycerol-3-phosphate acyltransferase PlsY
MELFINLIFVISYSYFLGCFCSAYYLVRISSNQDIRNINSGTVGARNAGRILGKKGFIITFICDSLKTILALALTIKYFPTLLAASIISVMLGHMFPLQLKFKGGKGVVPFTAIIFVTNFLVLSISLTTLFSILAITRNQKLSIMMAILLTIPSSLIMVNYYPIFLNHTTISAIGFAIILIIFSHV